MSQTEAITCKIPLLDGEDTTRPQLIETELELENVERLHYLGERDPASFNAVLCTAWGLLLRCYAGQDDVSFHFRQDCVDGSISNSAGPREHQSMFRIKFHEDENLSTCVARAKDGFADDERVGPFVVSTESDSRTFSVSRNQNTSVWVQNATCKVSQDVIVPKVCQSTLSNANLKSKI